MISFFSALYFKKNFLYLAGLVSSVFIVAHFIPFLLLFAFVILGLGVLILSYNLFYVFVGGEVRVQRKVSNFLSNGDENKIQLQIASSFSLPVVLEVIEEVPFQFQNRKTNFKVKSLARKSIKLKYSLTPKTRGEYHFGHCNVFVSFPFLPIISRRFVAAKPQMVKVYPSFQKLNKYELLGINAELKELGAKKVRKLGQQSEFEKIKEYVQGDDVRTINWKATARKSQLMVNQYQDEKSQNVISLIDMGRTMKSAFDEMTLLDYAINASLMLSSISLRKQDHAGLVTFSDQLDTFIAPNNTRKQLKILTDALYKQSSVYKESNYERLYIQLRRRLGQRSLVFLYTNFETWSSLNRQIRYLRRIAQLHLLVVVFFENKYISELARQDVRGETELFEKIVAEKQQLAQHKMRDFLNQYGIHAIYTRPEQLSVAVLNKYIELKSRSLI